jgi:hypothetical protein
MTNISQHANADRARLIKDIANAFVLDAVYGCKEYMHPVSTVCTMGDAFVIAAMEYDAPAALAYFRAALDVLELEANGAATDAAYQSALDRRAEAFERLARIAVIKQANPKGPRQ